MTAVARCVGCHGIVVVFNLKTEEFLLRHFHGKVSFAVVKEHAESVDMFERVSRGTGTSEHIAHGAEHHRCCQSRFPFADFRVYVKTLVNTGCHRRRQEH